MNSSVVIKAETSHCGELRGRIETSVGRRRRGLMGPRIHLDHQIPRVCSVLTGLISQWFTGQERLMVSRHQLTKLRVTVVTLT